MAGVLRLGTRGSALAVAQATAVARALETHGAQVELVTVRTSGDEPPRSEPRRADSGDIPAAIGPETEDKARFVKELEQALLAGEIDLAVHSAKDVPAELPDGLEIVAVPERADPRDALCLAPRLASAAAAAANANAAADANAAAAADAEAAAAAAAAATAAAAAATADADADAAAAAAAATAAAAAAHLDANVPPRHSLAARALDVLPEGAVVGTASLRRRAELLALRPDLEIRELRGNVDTRLRRLAAAETDGAAADGSPADGRPLDAIVLAAAGLARLGRSAEGSPLPEIALIPAAGQGCLALEARSDDDATRKLASRLTDPRAFACLSAERALVTAIGATCHTPVGAHATIVNHSFLELNAFVGTPDGRQWIRDDVRGLAETPQAVGHDAANRLVAAGAPAILATAETDG